MLEGQRCNTSSGGRGAGGSGSRSSKKPKQEKIPQRGLGVAELERILHDQQRNSGAAAPPTSGLVLPLPLPQVRSPPPVVATEFDPPFRTAGAAVPNSLSNTQVPPHAPAKNHALHGRAVGVPGGGYEGRSVLPLQNDTMASPVWWYSSQQPRRPPPPPPPHQPYQQHLQSKATPCTSFSPSSSGVHLQMEPPSNQINYLSAKLLTAPPWTEGDKNPWSYVFEHTSDGCSCNNRPLPNPDHIRPFVFDPFKFEQRNVAGRDGSHHLGSSADQVDQRSSCNLRGLDSSMPTAFSSATSKRPTLTHSPFHERAEEPAAAPQQGRSPQATFYEFLPVRPTSQEKSPGMKEEADDDIDLNLKL